VSSIAAPPQKGSSLFWRVQPIRAPRKRSLFPCWSRESIRLRVARDAESSGFYVAFSPEREDPGNDTVARRDIPKGRGGCGPVALELASLSTQPSSTAPFRLFPAAAEMTKLLENIYRCVNIALVNELKQLCMRMASTCLKS